MTSANHPPLNGAGADSVDPAWTLRSFRVKVVDIEGPAWFIDVRAIGKYNARDLARQAAYDSGAERPAVLTIEEVTS